MEKEHLAKGTLLFHGTYRIEGKLGQGGFGITYLATDVALDKYVAIKEFFPNTYCKRDTSTSRVGVATEGSREFVTRLKLKFLKEVRNIAKLDHPNIVRLHAAFEENDTAYYVMDYIEGTPLSQVVKTRGSLDRCKAVEYATLIGNALTYLHERRINHLDVKPANIMVRRSDGVPVLIDFGLAKQYDCEGQQTTSTPVGFSQGFAPVEQYKPGGVKEFSPASDLYSLAATLYFMLSGRIPPPATDLVDEPLTFPESFPSDLKKPIEKAMSASRKSRHASVEQFLREINPDRQTSPHSTEEDTTFEDTTYEEPAIEADEHDESSVYNIADADSVYSLEDDDEIIEPHNSHVQRISNSERISSAKKEIKPKETDHEGEGRKNSYGFVYFAIGLTALLLLGLAIPKMCNSSYKGSDSDSMMSYSEPTIPYDVNGEAEGHEYVDLGLPSGTLWATTNVGASKPWEFGDSFTWYGDKLNEPVEPQAIPKDLNISGNEYYDAARRIWGGRWRVPTVEEMTELVNNTDFQWTEMNGVKGGQFTAHNGNSIFIPNTLHYEGEPGSSVMGVWTATRYSEDTTPEFIKQYCIEASFGSKDGDYVYATNYGWMIDSGSDTEYMSVRPVMSPNRK